MWWIFPVLAAEPLLHVGDAERAVIHAAEDAGLGPWELTPTHLANLVEGEGPTLVGAAPATCAAPVVVLDPMREAIKRAERHLARANFPSMILELEPQLQLQGCLTVPAESSLFARAWFLLGYARFEAGDLAGAESAYRTALAWQPALLWEARIDPDRGVLFERLRAEPAPDGTTLYLGPGILPTALWIDGRLQPASGGRLALAAGEHLVQLLEPARTWHLSVVPGMPLALLDPAALASADAADPALQPVIDVLRVTRWPEAQRAWLWDGASTWRWQGTWEALPPSPRWARERQVRVGHVLEGAGVATLVLGTTTSIVALVGLSSTTEASNLRGEPAVVDHDWRQRTADAQATLAVVGGVVALTGAAGAGVGGWMARGGAGLSVGGAW